MPHPQILSSTQIAELVEDRTKNSTPFRILGSRFGIGASTAYTYWKKHGNYTDNSTGGMSNAQTSQYEDLEAEILSWETWFSDVESSNQTKSYRRKCKRSLISNGHNSVSDEDSIGIRANPTVRKNDNKEQLDAGKSALNEPDVFITSSGTRKRFY